MDLSDVTFYFDYEDAENAYNEYLERHIRNTIKSWTDVLLPTLQENPNVCEQLEDICEVEVDDGYLKFVGKQISYHDESKYDEDEYIAYRNNFYPTCEADLNEYNQKQYDLAWLRHIHLNKHHPQHWLLQRDSGECERLDMDLEFVLEMLCDWHSFSAIYPDSTAYKWYTDNKDSILISERTAEIVELLIPFMKDKSLYDLKQMGNY